MLVRRSLTQILLLIGTTSSAFGISNMAPTTSTSGADIGSSLPSTKNLLFDIISAVGRDLPR